MIRVELKQIGDACVDNIHIVDGDSRRHVGTVGKKGCGHDGPYSPSIIADISEQEEHAIIEAIKKRDGGKAGKAKQPPPSVTQA